MLTVDCPWKVKVNSILYKSLDTQEYLTSSQFSNSEAKLLFALRSHSIRGIKANFSSAHKEDIYCPLKCEATPLLDDQRHLLVCKSLCRNLSTSHLEALRKIQYEDIYGPIHSQKEAVNIFLAFSAYVKNCWNTRRLHLQLPVATHLGGIKIWPVRIRLHQSL